MVSSVLRHLEISGVTLQRPLHWHENYIEA